MSGLMFVIVLTITAIQFINIMDFMMIMPLGADIVTGLNIATAQMGLIGSVHKGAAAFSALFCIFVLDRFSRRQAMLCSLAGLLSGIAITACAENLYSLLLGRLIAGLFSAPVTALAIALVIYHIPAQRRGYALSVVMTAFSLVTIVGIPASLELAQLEYWRLPFFILFAMGLFVLLVAYRYLPRQCDIFRVNMTFSLLYTQFRQKSGLLYLTTALTMFTGFLLIPHLSIYLQYNLAYPRESLGFLYLCGGIASFLAVQSSGYLVNRVGFPLLAFCGSLLLLFVLYQGFLNSPHSSHILPLFVGFMVALALRNVATTNWVAQHSATTRCSGFIALNAAIQHIASALGSLFSGYLLHPLPTGELVGMPIVASIAMLTASTLPILIWLSCYRDAQRLVTLPYLPSQERICP
ncbi:MFS transporter [Beggiatoa leptomitoformis]|uniref:MFS transporter n=1 Tax=Beggiatoa leptomitoformis TaxID=288004 RepID=A0A2N9YIJ4_9GAMM|nr:MFS transporter [Beggiatoa leptomitoformis]ALG67416.1 MFS transporter [Beggiatoa leptomitoformis]AUI70371.1 MFS transporter [Beggiatoa leptomitoformis]